MTENNKLKKLIRERMSITGEKYTTARKFILPAYSPMKRGQEGGMELADFVLSKSQLQLLRDSITSPGISFVVGSCGSGKTSFASALLEEELKKGRMAQSYEDIDFMELWGLDKYSNLTPYSSGKSNYKEYKELVKSKDQLIAHGKDTDVIFYSEIRGHQEFAALNEFSQEKSIITTKWAAPTIKDPDPIDPLYRTLRILLDFSKEPENLLRNINSLTISYILKNHISLSKDSIFSQHKIFITYPIDDIVRSMFVTGADLSDTAKSAPLLDYYQQIGVPSIENELEKYKAYSS
jgi:hypothetical protein